MSATLDASRSALAASEGILKGVRSALQAEEDAKKTPLRQSTEFAIVGVQADLESASALLAELSSGSEPFFEARAAALAKNAAFVLERLSALLLSLSTEEPLFQSYERIGENLDALNRAAKALRGAAGPAGTQEIMALLGVQK